MLRVIRNHRDGDAVKAGLHHRRATADFILISVPLAAAPKLGLKAARLGFPGSAAVSQNCRAGWKPLWI